MVRDIRDLIDSPNLCITVVLKDGDKFERKDPTPDPFGNNMEVVSFWEGNAIRMYPMSEVKYVEIIPE